MLEGDDYGLKVSIKVKLWGAAGVCRVPLERLIRLHVHFSKKSGKRLRLLLSSSSSIIFIKRKTSLPRLVQ
jgi:hypothetical protein